MKSLKVKFDFIKLFLFEIEFVSGNDKGESKDEIGDIESVKSIVADNKQP